MLPEALIEKIALFYYLTYLDEAKALSAVRRTLKTLERHSTGAKANQLEIQTEVVSTIERFLKKARLLVKPSSLSFSAGSIVTVDELDWGPWFEFRKVATDREFRAVVYSRILKFSDQAIADGMELPVGTVRYRLSHGLKTLGQILSEGARSQAREGHHV